MWMQITGRMRIFLLIFTLFFGLLAQGQDSLYAKKNLTVADIEIYYSFYNQDGRHSAVTGGLGTERLKIHSVGTNMAFTRDTAHTVIFETYVDAITSASTDNIDFVESSASLHDRHISIHAGYQYASKKAPFLIGGKYLFGLESDYTSHGFNFWYSRSSRDMSQTFSASLVCFFDDLRWGRLDAESGFRPVKLIYPYELRYREWFDIYRRNSYNLQLSFKQDLNRKLSLQFDVGILYQEGLLSTSFHRIFFYDSDSGVVENLPRQRTQVPLGIGLNAFLTNSLIFKAYYRFFFDDFGIRAHTFTLESPVKFGYKYTLYPFLRFYNQTGARYFKPFGEHSVNDTFYTSDYDLSTFNSYKAGLGFGFFSRSPFRQTALALQQHGITLRLFLADRWA